MKNLTLILAATFLVACGNTELVGGIDCAETYMLSLDEGVHDMSIASNGDLIAIAWHESGWPSHGRIAVFDPENPPDVLESTVIDSEAPDAWYPQILWENENPVVFWTRIYGDDHVIAMAEYDLAAGKVSEPIELHRDLRLRLTQVTHHPEGEYGLVWETSREDDASLHAYFGRFSGTGDLISLAELDEGHASKSPRIEANANGYSVAFNRVVTSDGILQVMSRDYDLDSGFASFEPVSSDDSFYEIVGLASTDADQIVVWRDRFSGVYDFLYASFMVEDHMVNVQLDMMTDGIDTMSVPDENVSRVSWCGMDPTTYEITLRTMSLTAPTLEMSVNDPGEGGCTMTRLVDRADYPLVFWLDDTTKNLSYRSVCGM